MGTTVRMVPTDPETGNPIGPAVEVPEDQVAIFSDRNFAPETAQQRASTSIESEREKYYTRPAARIAAGVGATARLVSGGISDAAVRAFGSDEAREDLAALREYNSGLSSAIEIGGSVLPIGVGGLAARAGEMAAGLIKGTGALAQIGRAGVSGVVEGGIGGGADAITKISLSSKPVDLENALAQFSSDALFGGGIGGAAGSLAKGADLGLKKARARLAAARSASTGADDVAAEFVGKTKAQLDADEVAERAQLATNHTAKKAAVVEDTAAYRDMLREKNPFLVIKGSESSDLAATTKRIEKALKTPETLATNPGVLAGALEEQGTAIKRAIAGREALTAKLEGLNQKIATDLAAQVDKLAPDASVTLTGDAMKRYGQFADVRIPGKTKAHDITRDEAARFVDALNNGAVRTTEQKALAGLDDVLEANQALRANVREAMLPESKLTSERLTQIGKAKASADALASRKSGFLEDAAQSAIIGYGTSQFSDVPFVGAMIGAKLARHATGRVFGKLGKATDAAASRTGSAIDAFLNVGGKVAPRVPVVASKVLARVRFSEASDTERETQAGEVASGKATLPKLFKQRAAEIRAQTEYGPEGKAQMRPAARQRLAAKLAPIAAHDPIVADKLETIAARRIEFLANKLPRRPEITGIPIGPDRWQPSDLEMREFARYVHAVEDPYGVVERLSTGDVTPEDAQALREVYPDIFHDVRWRIAQKLPELRQQLPYSRRVALSIFSGVPVDPAMHPQVLAVLQGQFAEEPGSEGGTQMPTAAPQFGSVSKPNATPAQERAG
jgi:hypothetical protein